MMKSTEIAFRHAEYVDPRAGNDKFYRTYVIGSSWVTQYGRNGTAGTFTRGGEIDGDRLAVSPSYEVPQWALDALGDMARRAREKVGGLDQRRRATF